MYIIHDSGILLYEHNFIKEKDKLGERNVSADLKAGGIIGIKTILKEIVQMMLRESYFRYALRDDDEAFSREKMAEEVYNHYQSGYDEYRIRFYP